MAKHRNDPNMPFWLMLKEGYDHFEVTGQPPKVDVCDRRYVFNARAGDGKEFHPGGAVPADVDAGTDPHRARRQAGAGQRSHARSRRPARRQGGEQRRRGDPAGDGNALDSRPLRGAADVDRERAGLDRAGDHGECQPRRASGTTGIPCPYRCGPGCGSPQSRSRPSLSRRRRRPRHPRRPGRSRSKSQQRRRRQPHSPPKRRRRQTFRGSTRRSCQCPS